MFERTREFVSAVETLRRFDAAAATGVPVPAVRLPPRHALHARSRALADEISSAATTVQRLARLSTRRGLFDDPAAEVNALTAAAKAALLGLDASVTALAAAAAVVSQSLAAPPPSIPLRTALIGLMVQEGVTAVAAEKVLRVPSEDDDVGDFSTLYSGNGVAAFSAFPPPLSGLALPVAASSRRISAPTPSPPIPVHALPQPSPSPAQPLTAIGAGSDEAALAKAWQARQLLCPHWSLYCQQHPAGAAAGSAAPVGSPRAHWAAVAATLRSHVVATTRAFQDALRTRCDNMKEQSERRRTLARSTWAPLVDMSSPLFQALPAQPPPPPQPHLPPEASAASDSAESGGPLGVVGAGAQAARRRHAPYPQIQAAWARTGPPTSVSSAANAAAAYGGGATAYTTQQLARYHDAAGRAQEMRKVESTIVELGTMFSRMTSLVAEQGDVIERIDADTIEVLDNVREAQSQLEQYFASISSNRGLILRLLAVAAFVAALLLIYKR